MDSRTTRPFCSALRSIFVLICHFSFLFWCRVTRVLGLHEAGFSQLWTQVKCGISYHISAATSELIPCPSYSHPTKDGNVHRPTVSETPLRADRLRLTLTRRAVWRQTHFTRRCAASAVRGYSPWPYWRRPESNYEPFHVNRTITSIVVPPNDCHEHSDCV